MVLLCGLCSIVVYQNWERSHPRSRLEVLNPGNRVGIVAVETLQGTQTQIEWTRAGTPTIVYVFSPDCQWCRRNHNAERTVVEGTTGRYRFIGLSLTKDGLNSYISENNINYPVYIVPRGAPALKQLGIRGTPETIIISNRGIVQKVWAGAYAYNDTTRREIEGLLAIKIAPVNRD